MSKLKLTIPMCVIAVVLTTATQAGDFDSQIEARQSWMKLMGYHSGILGNMVRGRMDYDADLATASAKNMALAAQMNNASMWPMGSDMSANDNTVAKAELWQNFADAGQHLSDLASATKALEMNAGNGLEALQASMKSVGEACSGCHRQFRAKR